MTRPAFKTLLLAGAMSAALTAPAFAEMRIGVAGPFTGQYAVFGEQMRRGAEKAVADINARGGLLGQTVELVISDDACDPKQAVAVANQLVSEGVTFVAGHYCSGSSIPASDIYEEEGVVMISPASTNPQLTDDGKWNVFRVCGRDDQQGSIAGAYLAENFADAVIGIAHDRQTYSQGLANETKRALNEAGIEEAFYETITPGERDYSAFVSRLKEAGVEVLYYGGYHTEAALLIRQMRDQGLDTVLMSGDGLISNEFWTITGDAGAGTLMTFSPDATKEPENAEIVQQFLDTGYNPEGYTLYSYATIQVWAQAVEKVGDTDPDAVAEALRDNSFNTVLGPIDFDDKGDVADFQYVVYEWADGDYDYVTN